MLLGYKKRFVMPIKIGTKVHTMRKPRKIEPKIGEQLYMYTALRTAHCELITNKETLRGKQKVRVVITRRVISQIGKRKTYTYTCTLFVDGRKLNDKELAQFVKYDGFTDLADFCAFWFVDEKETCKKVGGIMNLYHWTDLKY